MVDGLGMKIKACSKGWLPHGFSFMARVVDLEAQKWMKVMLSGDFDGYGLLGFKQVETDTSNIYLHLDVDVWHPYLRFVLAPLRPRFLLNHKWWAARKATKLLQKEIYCHRNVSVLR